MSGILPDWYKDEALALIKNMQDYTEIGKSLSTPSKRKGSAWELAIAKYLVQQGWKRAERRIAGSNLDKGDINGIDGCTIEAKNEKRINLSGYLKELEVEMKNAKADTGVVMIKKTGTTDVGEAYAVMPIKIWVSLMKEAGYGPKTRDKGSA